MSEEKHYELTIEPNKKMRKYWAGIWNYRELILFLAKRDISVKYKQTVIGILWVVIKPLLSMLIISFIFGTLARLDSGGVPYPILVYSALLPWQFFATNLSATGDSMVNQTNLITKVYFPRMVIPFSIIIANLFDLTISFGILVVLMIWFTFIPPWTIIAIPIFLFMCIIVSLGAGLLIAALNVKYRDFALILPFIVQIGTYISPVGFYSTIIPESWRLLYSLNPLVGVIDGFRWAILGKELNIVSFLISTSVAIIIFIIGIWYFRKTEYSFADII